jgi:hypothetical protein
MNTLEQDAAAECRRLFAENTTKLGTLASALGIPADLSVGLMRERVRQHVAAHAKLLGAANEVLASSKPSLGDTWVRPAAIERLREAVAFTQERAPVEALNSQPSSLS